MAEESIAMTHKAIDRLEVIQQTAIRQLRQKDAARQRNLSVRQVKRLVARFRQEGPARLWSRSPEARTTGNFHRSGVLVFLMIAGYAITATKRTFVPKVAATRLSRYFNRSLAFAANGDSG